MASFLKLETPVEIGKPVHELNVPELGVPKTGVTNVGDVFKTTLPVPVLDVTPVPPFATGTVPVRAVALTFDHVGAAEAPPEVRT
jgi:hypothetical protein